MAAIARLICRAGLCLLLAAVLFSPRSALAEAPLVSAKELFRLGVAAVEQGDLAEALAYFQKAYEQSPNQTVLFNIAQTQIALGRPVDGVRSLRRYVELDRGHEGNPRSQRARELLRYTERRLGKLELHLIPADAVLEVDGAIEKPDASGMVEVVAGRRQLVVTRSGFATAVQHVSVEAGAIARASVKLEPMPAPLPVAARPVPAFGRLEVKVDKPGAVVLVDGAPLQSPTVPPGTYVIEVTRNGYRSWRRNVQVNAGEMQRVAAVLERVPPPQEASRTARKRWSIVSGVVGAGLVGGGVGLYLVNNRRYADFRRDQDALFEELASGVSEPSHAARAGDLSSRAARLQRTDDAALGIGLLGGALLAVSGTLLMWDVEF